MDKNLTHYFFTMRNKKVGNMRTREVIRRRKIEFTELLKTYLTHIKYSKILELTEQKRYTIVRMSHDDFIIKLFNNNLEVCKFCIAAGGVYTIFQHDIIEKEIKRLIYVMI